MDTPIFDLDLIQGIALDLVVSDWADLQGNVPDVSTYIGHLTVRDRVGGNVLIDLKSEDGEIEFFPRQMIASFSEELTAQLVPLADSVLGPRPIKGSHAAAPKYRCGVYEFRVARPTSPNVHYPVVAGDVNITLGIVSND